MFRNGPEIQESVILERLFTKWKLVTQPEEYLIQQLRALLDSPEHTPETKLQVLIDNYLAENPTILIFDNFEDVQTEGDDTQQQAIVSESLRTFMHHLLQQAPSSCPVLLTSRYLIRDLADLVTHLAIDRLTSAEQYRYINFSDVLRKIPLTERAIIDRRFDGHPRALQFLEGLLSKDRHFDLAKIDASMGAVEARIFENLLLQRIYDRLSEAERELFLAGSIFFSRTPLTALESVLQKPADELVPVLTALRDWSLCFWDEQEQLFEVHALTRAWLHKQEQPAQDQFRTLSQQAGEFFRSQHTWDDQLLAKTYFEQAEAWEAYAETTFNLESHYQLIGLYPVARDLAHEVLAKNISPYYNATAQNRLGLLDLHVGNYAQALSYLEQSLNICQQIGDKSGESTTLNNISQIYRVSGDYDQALSYLEQSLSIRQQIGDKSGEGAILNNISQIYDAQGDYAQALSYLEQSLSIYQQIGDKSGESAALNNIGNIYHVEGDYSGALNYLGQSLNICQQIGDKKGEGTTLNNIGQIYAEQGDYDQALNCLEQSLSIRQQIGDKKGEGTTLNNIGRIYTEQGDYDQALNYLEQSLSIRQQIGDKYGQATTMHNLGILYCNQFQNLEKATPLLIQAYVIFIQLGSPNAKVPLSYIEAIFKQVGAARFNQLMQGG